MRPALATVQRDAQSTIAETAERLFANIGFQKTTVADIARELHMSPANIYRFYASKAEINKSVAAKLLAGIEIAVDDIVSKAGPASAKLRAVMVAIEALHGARVTANHKLHDLLETAFNESWPIVREHVEKLDKALGSIISQGAAAGHFHVDDIELSAMLTRSACIRIWHPRVMVEYAEQPEPTLDQMVDFCLAGLAGPAVGKEFQRARLLDSLPATA